MKNTGIFQTFPNISRKTQNYSNLPDPDPIRYLKMIFLTADLTLLSGYEI